jgi:hypothetical protein
MGSARHRCLHPLNRAESNAVICVDPPETLTAGFQRGADRLGLLGGHPGAAEHLPLRLGAIQPSHDAFADQCSLELRKHAQHLKHRGAGRGAAVEALLVQVEADAEGANLLNTMAKAVLFESPSPE